MDEEKIVVPSHKRTIALELLKDFHGYLTTDAYKVYEYLGNKDIKHNFCWSQELPDKCRLSQSKKMHLKK